MMGEEGAKLVRPPGERKEDVGHEARFLLHRGDPLADVLRQIGKLGRRKSADRRLGHGIPRFVALRVSMSPSPSSRGAKRRGDPEPPPRPFALWIASLAMRAA